jgi:hypothetical protein
MTAGPCPKSPKSPHDLSAEGRIAQEARAKKRRPKSAGQATALYDCFTKSRARRR